MQQLSDGFRKCVHCEHRGSLTTERMTAPQPTPMPSYRILRCLTTLGWSERELARRTGRHQTTIRRWIDGSAVIDQDVAEWLQLLAQFHRDHPAPRLAPLVRPQGGKPDNHQRRQQRAGQAEPAHVAVV